MIDRAVIGRAGEPFELRVELGKIREFARATMSHNLAYLEAAEPFIPITFLMTAAFWAGDSSHPLRALGLDNRRLLHGGQSFSFDGEPPRAGAVLTGHSVIEDVYEKQGSRGGTMEFVVVRTDYIDAAGKSVARVRSTAIYTSKAATG
jgi:MaoC dehydratase-like protein